MKEWCGMILSGREIIARQGDGLEISPFNPAYVNPNSYDLHLADKLFIYDDCVLDMKRPNAYKKVKIHNDGFVLQPGRLYLGRTMEYTKTWKYVPMIEGRSSVGRLGVHIHATAGFGDVGFEGYWTLELSCVQSVRIYPGVGICQIFYHTLDGNFDLYKSGKYQKNDDIQPSLMYRDFVEAENGKT